MVMSNDSLYQKSNFNRIGEFKKLSSEAFRAFGNFDQKALSEGLLNSKVKELMAVAIAHVTGCPYCIEDHVKRAKKKEVSKEEMAEAIMVATALKAGSALAHSINALNAYDDIEEEALYKKSYLNRFNEFSSIGGEAFKAFGTFDVQAMKAGKLSVKEKELIAIAIAHVTGCPYCIEVHVKGAKKAGVTKEEMAEAIMVATALKAGSALAHGVNALNAYDE
jgi:AhpD family alkylhydroperoxidase